MTPGSSQKGVGGGGWGWREKEREYQESRPLVGKGTANSENKDQEKPLHLFAILNPALK